jgi:tight adherence protein B
MLAHRLVLLAIACAALGAVTGWTLTRFPSVSLALGLAGGFAPFFKVMLERKQRFDRLEEQMPDAIDVMKRALRAGHPFASTLKLVADDMDQPIAREFEQTFADINYGNDLRRALLGLLTRVPSVSVMALTTGVLVQKETGGNLAEILDQISKVIRARFRFYRKVRTLSAEGRLSAWILTLVPIVLFGVIWITTPEYLPVMLQHPMGQNFMVFAGFMMVLGVLWIRRIIRLQV